MKLVDPNGAELETNTDWYKNNKTGEIGWQEGHSKQIVDKNGNTYSNIGESYSKPIGDGRYENYYQNCLVSRGEKQDASRLAHNNKSVFNALISKKSPLPTSHKQDLFNRHVANRGGYSPDMLGLQLSGNLVVGGGYTADVMLGYVRERGFFLSFASGAACGFDISAGIGLCLGRNLSSTYPSVNSLKGLSYSSSFGVGPFCYQESISAQRNNRWSVSTYGVSWSLIPPASGNAGVSYLFLPLQH